MHRRILGVVVALLMATSAPGAFAQGDVFNAIPNEAVGFVVINGLEATSGKFEKLGQKLQMPLPNPLQMVKAMTGVQTGVDEKGTAAAIFLPKGQGDGQSPGELVVLIPVSNYQEFLAQFKPEDAKADVVRVQVGPQAMVVGQKGKFAAFANQSSEAALKRVLKSRKDVSASVKPLRDWLAKHDIAAALTPSGVQVTFEQISKGLDQVDAAMAQMPQGEQVRKIMEVYREIIKKVQYEVTHVAIGMRIEDTGSIHLTSRSIFVPAGSFAKSLAEYKAPEDPLLGLPSGPFVFAGGGSWPETWNEGLANFSVKAMKFNPLFQETLTDEQAKKLGDATARMMKGLRGFSMVLGEMKKGDPLYANAVALMRVDDADKYFAEYLKSFKEMQEVLNAAKEGKKVYEIRKVKVGARSGAEITMDMKLLTEGSPGQPTEMFEKMFGGPKLKTYLVVIDKKTLGLSYVNPQALKRVIASHQAREEGLSKNPAVAKTKAALPSGAQWVGYASPKGIVDFAMGMVESFAPPNMPRPQLPPFPDTQTLGFAAKFTSTRVDTDLVVPGDVMEAIGAYIMQARQGAPGGIEPEGAPQIEKEAVPVDDE